VEKQPAICRFVLILSIVTASFSGLMAQNASPSGDSAIITRGANFTNIDEIMNAAVAREIFQAASC